MKHPAGELSQRLQDGASRMGVPLDPDVARALVVLMRRMLDEPQNLTAITDELEAVDRHLADSLAGLVVPMPDGPLCDIGSGGGMPGLVLATMLSPRPVVLVESERRKADWLVRAAGALPNVTVLAERTEEVANRQREAFSVVTARAVAPPIPTLELGAPLVCVGGTLLAWSALDSADEWEAAADVARHLGFGPATVHDVTPFPHSRRSLLAFRKHDPTPAAYPRRPGRATKRPLDTGRLRRT